MSVSIERTRGRYSPIVRRLIPAVVFGAASLITVQCLLSMLRGFDIEGMTIEALIASVISGALIGPVLLDRHKTRTVWAAVGYGLLIMLLAYVLFSLLIGNIAFFIILLFGLIYTGWFSGIVAAVVAALLWRIAARS